MCRTKMAIQASQPSQITKHSPPPQPPASTKTQANISSPLSPSPSPSPPSPSPSPPSSDQLPSTSASDNSAAKDTWQTAAAAAAATTTMAALRSSLPCPPQIYTLSELRSATNNFLSKPYASSSSSWRCSLRRHDALLHRSKTYLPHLSTDKLSAVCRSHHRSVARLLGAAVYGGTIYLAHEFVNGVALSVCLRNPINPNFTILSTWLSRVKVAADVADGLDYIHNSGALIGAVHGRLDSGNVVISEPSMAAKICRFGTAEIGREGVNPGEVKGVIGYMAPEIVIAGGGGSQPSDVYAFGVLILELVSGEEAVTVKYDGGGAGGLTKSSVVERARDAVDGGDVKLRRWVDWRMRDSFPVDVVLRMVHLALACVRHDPNTRPNMRAVAGKVSKLLLKSRVWMDKVMIPSEISVSVIAPR